MPCDPLCLHTRVCFTHTHPNTETLIGVCDQGFGWFDTGGSEIWVNQLHGTKRKTVVLPIGGGERRYLPHTAHGPPSRNAVMTAYVSESIDRCAEVSPCLLPPALCALLAAHRHRGAM